MLLNNFLKRKALASGLAASAFFAMAALGGVGANAQTGIYYTPAQQAVMAQQPNQMTQADVDAMTDPTAKRSAQWSLNKAKEWQTQADGRERITDLNSAGKQRLFFTPQKLTAADCLVGRHWELVPPAGIAACVCDGDLKHKAVSNDDPNACVVVPPPKCPNGATDYPICTPPSCIPEFIAQCEGDDSVVRNSCTGSEISRNPGFCRTSDPVITVGAEYQTLACPPPSVGAATQQTRTITFTNGVPTAYGAWTGPSPQCVINPPAERAYLETYMCPRETWPHGMNRYFRAWIFPSELLAFQAESYQGCLSERE